MSCMDDDVLVGLATALEDEADHRIRHLVACPDCMERLSRVSVVRSALKGEIEPREGFVDTVMETLAITDVGATAEPTPNGGLRRHTASWLIDVANPILATLSTFFAVLLVGQSTVTPGVPVIGLAVGVGLATSAWDRLRRPGSELESAEVRPVA